MKVIKWDYLYDKIIRATNCKGHDIDIRYLQRWMKVCPKVFPKFMLENNYLPVFDWEKLKWFIYEQ